jgi:hypothetical protein
VAPDPSQSQAQAISTTAWSWVAGVIEAKAVRQSLLAIAARLDWNAS